jgi:hypothetical protein
MANLYGWTAGSWGDEYLEKCKLFSESDVAFSNFRRDNIYGRILEGGQRIVGKIHLDRMRGKETMGFLLDNAEKFRENDIYGNPVILDFEEIKQINPCTILYVSCLSDIKTFLGDFKPKKIIEIGGGFGGQCKVFSSIYDFDEYIMIDLPEAISLCKKYMSHFPEIYSKITFITTEDLKTIKPIENIDLFIAVASLAECDEETQNYYIDNFLLQSKFGYIVYNTAFSRAAIYVRILEKISRYFKISNEPVVDVQFLFLKNIVLESGLK